MTFCKLKICMRYFGTRYHLQVFVFTKCHVNQSNDPWPQCFFPFRLTEVLFLYFNSSRVLTQTFVCFQNCLIKNYFFKILY